MKRIILKLISEHTNLSKEPFGIETVVHKKYDYHSKRITHDSLRELFNSIKSITKDQIVLKVVTDKHNIYTDITFLSITERDMEFTIPNKIVKLVDNFFLYEHIQNTFSKSKNDTYTDEKITEEDSIENPKGSLIQFKIYLAYDELDFLKDLEKENDDFEVISHSFLSTDMGASILMIEAIVYVSNAAASGVLWDFMKAKAKELRSLGDSSIKEDAKQLDDIAFEKFKKSVSDRSKVHVHNLTLVSTERDENTVLKEPGRFFKFKTDVSYIEVVSDEQYVIKKFHTVI